MRTIIEMTIKREDAFIFFLGQYASQDHGREKRRGKNLTVVKPSRITTHTPT